MAWVAGMIDLRPTSRQCTRLGPMGRPGRLRRAPRVMNIKRKRDDEIRIWTGAGAGKSLLPLPRVAAALSGLGERECTTAGADPRWAGACAGVGSAGAPAV